MATLYVLMTISALSTNTLSSDQILGWLSSETPSAWRSIKECEVAKETRFPGRNDMVCIGIQFDKDAVAQ